ncbi:hypothetical protein SLS55_005110 [Diplodia seriata]|uniref:Autophagy-related protein 27 n=1 Tax=Diplodia seriata TaxID=420778 RepID=A0ABR3CIT2_9PEZI
MTGYVPITASFIEIPETSQLIPWEKFTFGYYYKLPSGKDSPCFPPDILDAFDLKSQSKLLTCNSTCITHYWNETDKNVETGKITDPLGISTLSAIAKSSNCTFFGNETYDGVSWSLREMADQNNVLRQQWNPDNIKYNCSDVVNMTIDGMNYTYIDIWDKEVSSLCFNNTAYDDDTLASNSRCLPKTTQRGSRAGYQWGFSAMLTSAVLILHAVWAASLYAVWLDAELGSTLVKQGFRLTQLRGAYFAVAAMTSSVAGLDDKVKGRGTIPPPPPPQSQSPSPAALTTAAEEQGSFAEGREEGEEEEEEEQPVIGRRVRAADMEAMMEREDAMVRFELFEEELPFAGVVAYDGA